MQSDLPQGDPRLQRTKPGPAVAAGYVDPCIVFLETTLPGEVPLLAACWARSSREIQEPGGQTHWQLKQVAVLECRFDRAIHNRAPSWCFAIRQEESLILRHGVPNQKFIRHSYFSRHSEFTPPPVCRWAIRFLELEADAALRTDPAVRDVLGIKHPFVKLPLRELARAYRQRQEDTKLIAKKLFQHAKLDWPSIADALESLHPPFAPARVPRRRGPSLVRRLLTSVFKKKAQPVPA